MTGRYTSSCQCAFDGKAIDGSVIMRYRLNYGNMKGMAMKFEYEVSKDDRECVAFIDGDGDLWIKTDEGSCLMYKHGGLPESGELWEENLAIHKFYPGDKITITF